jgi:hypothetical protein
VGFDYQPDEEAGGQVERANGARRDVHFKGCAGFYKKNNHCAESLDRLDAARKNVSGAEEVRRFGGNEDVAGANGDADLVAGRGVTKRNFDFTRGVIERNAHDAVGGAMFHDNRGENIFEAGGVGEFDGARGIEHGAGSAAFLNAAVDECDDAFADGVDFFAIMRHVKNRNAVGIVPCVKIFEDRAAQSGIEACKRLIEKQDAGASNECAREGDTLLFAAGQFGGPAREKILDTKSACDASRTFGSFRESELIETVADILFDRKMREERQGLKNVGEFAVLRRERERAGRVKVKFFAEADFAGIGFLEAGDAIEQGGFSGAGWAEQDSEAQREGLLDVEHERLRAIRAKLFADLNIQHCEIYFASQGDHTRRFTP